MIQYPIQYPYAHNDKNELIHINSINKENKNDTIYKCPCCNHEMRPRLGNKQSHCFYHLPGIEPCSLESYLHKTAKEILYNRFKNKEDIYLEYNKFNIIKCNLLDKCNVSNGVDCVRKEKDKDNKLKLSKYSNIYLETYHNGFKPDILLESSDGKVLFIEICYTHKCEEEKINSGIPIIEIYINKESDLDWLEHITLFSENDDHIKMYNINYNSEINKDLCDMPNRCYVNRYILYPDNGCKNIVIKRNEIDIHDEIALMDITYNLEGSFMQYPEIVLKNKICDAYQYNITKKEENKIKWIFDKIKDSVIGYRENKDFKIWINRKYKDIDISENVYEQ